MIKIFIILGLLCRATCAAEWTLDGRPQTNALVTILDTNAVKLTGLSRVNFPPYLQVPQAISGRLNVDGLLIGEHNGNNNDVELTPSTGAISIKMITPSRTDGAGNAGDIILAPGVAYISGLNGKVIVESDIAVGGKITGDGSELSNIPFFYALQFEHGAHNPADSESYYIGGVSDLPPTSLQQASRIIYTHATGYIRKVSIHSSVGGNVGSSEPSTLKVSNLTKGTFSVITGLKLYVSAHEATNFTLISPLSVAAGDALTITWETPAWETNPSIVRNNFVVTVER